MPEILQFKSLSDLREIISELEGYVARPVVRGKHPVFYDENATGKYRTVLGVRICDYKFSADEQWVLVDDQMGLSFSSSWKNLKNVHRMMSRAKGVQVDVYWVLQGSDLPQGLAFVEDRQKKGHFFLTVTERTSVIELVRKLTWVADKMGRIDNAGVAL